MLEKLQRHSMRQRRIAGMVQEERLRVLEKIVQQRVQCVEALIEPQCMELLAAIMNDPAHDSCQHRRVKECRCDSLTRLGERSRPRVVVNSQNARKVNAPAASG